MKNVPELRQHIQQMHPYKPPVEGRSQKQYLRLDFNERTIPLPDELLRVITDSISEKHLHCYPEYGDICDQIAKYAQVEAKQVLITNGSDQGIDVIFRTFVSPGDQVIIPAPTFAMLPHSAELQGAEIISPPFTLEQGFPLTEVLKMISPKTRLIAICNPNNPTGTAISVSEIEELAKAAPQAAILVDECYFEYAEITAKSSISRFPNIVITRTFSKTWGLSALRLGYIIADTDLIEQFLKVRGPYDVNRVAVIAASKALESPEYMKNYVKEVMSESKPMIEDYLRRKGVSFWPSQANFILTYPRDSLKLEASLRELGILTRPRRGPNINNTLRFNFGTLKQAKRLIDGLEQSKKFLV